MTPPPPPFLLTPLPENIYSRPFNFPNLGHSWNEWDANINGVTDFDGLNCSNDAQVLQNHQSSLMATQDNPQKSIMIIVHIHLYICHCYFKHVTLTKAIMSMLHVSQTWGQIQKYLYMNLKVFKYFFSSICICIWAFQNEKYLYLNTFKKYLIFQIQLKYFQVFESTFQILL